MRQRSWQRHCRGFLVAILLSSGAVGSPCPARRPEATFPLPTGAYLNYKEAGQGDRVLVALHGFGASLDTWNDIEPLWTRNYHVFMVDLLGFGLSAKPKHFGYTLTEQAESVAAFLEFVNRQTGRTITVIGHSYGGSIAMAAWLTLKDRHRTVIDAIVLIDALGFPEAVHFPLYISILRVPVVNRLVLTVIPQRCQARIVLDRVFYRRALVTPARVCMYAQFLGLPGSHRALIRTAGQLGSPKNFEQFRRRITEIDVPTLVIWGAHDQLIPPSQAGLLQHAIKTAHQPPMLEAGHVPHEELPKSTASLIEAFLNASDYGLISLPTTLNKSMPIPIE
jgi:pimeloyl-ACP methyl ester carboxylesterase